MDTELLPDPLGQIDQAPSDHAVDRRGGPAGDDACQRGPLVGIQLGCSIGRLGVRQACRATAVEPQHPITDDLKPDTADPCRIATLTAS